MPRPPGFKAACKERGPDQRNARRVMIRSGPQARLEQHKQSLVVNLPTPRSGELRQARPRAGRWIPGYGTQQIAHGGDWHTWRTSYDPSIDGV